MSGNLKALGLALLVALALGMVANTAQGKESVSGETLFHSEVEHTYLIVEKDIEDHVLYTGSGEEKGKFICEGVGGSGTISTETVSEITLATQYSECEIEGVTGNFPVDVEFTSCSYIFTSEREKGEKHYEVHLACEEEDEIHAKITFLGFKLLCVTIPAQTPTGGGITYGLEVGEHLKQGLTIQITVEGLEYTTHENCGGNGEPYETLNNGVYTGDTLVWGVDTGEKYVDVNWD